MLKTITLVIDEEHECIKQLSREGISDFELMGILDFCKRRLFVEMCSPRAAEEQGAPAVQTGNSQSVAALAGALAECQINEDRAKEILSAYERRLNAAK